MILSLYLKSIIYLKPRSLWTILRGFYIFLIWSLSCCFSIHVVLQEIVQICGPLLISKPNSLTAKLFPSSSQAPLSVFVFVFFFLLKSSAAWGLGGVLMPRPGILACSWYLVEVYWMWGFSLANISWWFL